jgi:multiple sugar transport system permease protein
MTTQNFLVRRRSLRSREAFAGYLFVAPALLGFILFIAGPILTSFYFSLSDFRLITPPEWAGAKNYLPNTS